MGRLTVVVVIGGWVDSGVHAMLTAVVVTSGRVDSVVCTVLTAVIVTTWHTTFYCEIRRTLRLEISLPVSILPHMLLSSKEHSAVTCEWHPGTQLPLHPPRF